jgi:hypothetical protein
MPNRRPILYRLVPGGGVSCREQIREHRAWRLEPSLGGDRPHSSGRVACEPLSHSVAAASV